MTNRDQCIDSCATPHRPNSRTQMIRTRAHRYGALKVSKFPYKTVPVFFFFFRFFGNILLQGNVAKRRQTPCRRAISQFEQVERTRSTHPCYPVWVTVSSRDGKTHRPTVVVVVLCTGSIFTVTSITAKQSLAFPHRYGADKRGGKLLANRSVQVKLASARNRFGAIGSRTSGEN